jgi:putative phosphoesterase
MKIAIISDSHDNIPNTEKFLDWASQNNIGTIIHCGDVDSPSLIEETISPKFSGAIHLVYGNASHRDLFEELSDRLGQVNLHGDQGTLVVDGVSIAFCHFPGEANTLSKTGKYKLVFYGHTHKPWTEKIGDTVLVNPGTLGGVFSKASFAVYDTTSHNLELKILEIL